MHAKGLGNGDHATPRELSRGIAGSFNKGAQPGYCPGRTWIDQGCYTLDSHRDPRNGTGRGA